MPETAPPPAAESPDDAQNVIVLIIRWRVTRGLLVCLAVALSLFYLRTYERIYDPDTGWTRFIQFGAAFESRALPKVQRIRHFVVGPAENSGADGQFYAQIALDPSLRDPGLGQALDNPVYRARRIGLPTLAYVFGWFKPRRVLQAYALGNLFFWFVLMGVLFWLFRPRTGRHLLCLCAALLGYGVIASMELAVTDVPSAAMIFLALALGASWRGYGMLAAAALTRETSVLAAFSLLDPRRAWRQPGEWKRALALLALGLVPLALWVAYVAHRFGQMEHAAGERNFSLPFVAMFRCLADGVAACYANGLSPEAREAVPVGWLYTDLYVRQPLAIIALFCQVVYFFLRRDWSSAVWRTGFLYALLCSVLGTAVWEECTNAARATLPMTICFYLLLSRERGGWWFWPFFLLGSLAVPYAMHEFWTYS